MTISADSTRLVRSLFQEKDDGLRPISALHVKTLRVFPCSVARVRGFITTHHYSHSIDGVKVTVCFELRDGTALVGAALFGQMSTTAWKRFGQVESDVVELRRLVCLDECPKNTESRFVGIMLRWLSRFSTVRTVVSYADPNYGHSGVIYRASNFSYIGTSGDDVAFEDKESGRIYHSRALRTKYKGKFKPFVEELRKKRDTGRLEEINLLPKHCFVYHLKPSRIST